MEGEADLEVRSGQEFDQEKRGKVYFINNVNTMVGQSLAEEIRNDHLLLDMSPETAPLQHSILGTIDDKSGAPVPSGINKIVRKQKIRHWKKYLLASDVAIFDLLTSSLDEVMNAIHVLKTQDYEEEKTLILISNVITWVNTPPKKKPAKNLEESTDTDSELDRPEDLENTG